MVGKAKVELSREFIAHAISELSPGEMPADASLVGHEYDAERDLIVCVFESDEFPETGEGERVQKATVGTAGVPIGGGDA